MFHLAFHLLYMIQKQLSFRLKLEDDHVFLLVVAGSRDLTFRFAPGACAGSTAVLAGSQKK